MPGHGVTASVDGHARSLLGNRALLADLGVDAHALVDAADAASRRAHADVRRRRRPRSPA